MSKFDNKFLFVKATLSTWKPDVWKQLVDNYNIFHPNGSLDDIEMDSTITTDQLFVSDPISTDNNESISITPIRKCPRCNGKEGGTHCYTNSPIIWYEGDNEGKKQCVSCQNTRANILYSIRHKGTNKKELKDKFPKCFWNYINRKLK